MGRGTGLGLATVYGIVKQSGGLIWVYSEPGKEAAFKVYLPRVDEPAAAEPPARADSPRGTENMLVVEDMAAVRAAACRVVRRHGYTVLEAAAGEAALELASGHAGPIHLLLTDVVMPEMSGRRVADRLRESRPGLKVLYMSGYTDDAVVRHGVLESGIAYFAEAVHAARAGEQGARGAG